MNSFVANDEEIRNFLYRPNMHSMQNTGIRLKIQYRQSLSLIRR